MSEGEFWLYTFKMIVEKKNISWYNFVFILCYHNSLLAKEKEMLMLAFITHFQTSLKRRAGLSTGLVPTTSSL